MRNILIGFIGFFLLSACSDFLEEHSQDEVIVSTVTDYSELLLGTAYPTKLYDVLYLLDDDLAIDENLYYGDTENTSVTTFYGFFTWQPDMWERNTTATDVYMDIYSLIVGANAILDGIDEATGDDTERDYVKAEALGLRGFYYSLLVNLFGEPHNVNKNALGVPLKLTSGMVENGIARNTVSEVYDQIVEDLTTAADLFAKHPKRAQNFRMNETIVSILLSRTYLYMEDWENAVTAATRAIETAEGLTDYTELETGTSFSMPTFKHSEVEWRYGEGQLRRGFIPSTDLTSKYDENDRRLKFWFSTSGSLLKKTPDYSEGMGLTNTIRISEAYLNRAEAYAHLSDGSTAALADLNELRRHRIEGYTDVSISDPQLLLDEILLERRLELCFDELRWFDLRRLGMPTISHPYKAKGTDSWVTYTLEENDPLYTLPFSNNVLMNNGGLEQNSSAFSPLREGY